jgi:hypothetical protein
MMGPCLVFVPLTPFALFIMVVLTNLRRLVVPSLLAAAFGILPAAGGTYGPQSFNYPNNTTILGDGAAVSSSNGIASVQSSYLRLTANGTGNTSASFKLPDLDVGSEVEGFDLTFLLRMSTSGTPADGMSVNFGAIPGGDGGGEGGFALPKGLVIAWDTYNNGNDAPSIEIYSDGVSIGNYPQTFASVHNQWIPVVVHWDAAGLDLSYNGNALATNLATPNFIPASGNRLAFSGRTGGATQDTFIDDLLFTTTTTSPIQTGGPVISEFAAQNKNTLEDEDLESPDWVEIYNGQNASVNLGGYYLTNDPLNKTLWTLPAITLGAYQYTVVFASGKNRPHTTKPPHTNFTLPKTGGFLALIAPDGMTVRSEYTYGDQAEDITYGELGQARTRGFLETPTPGEKNLGLQATGAPAEDVVYSRAGGLFSGTVVLSISAPLSPTAVVRYTTNNTVPSEASSIYSMPFNISATTTIRARVYDVDRLPGAVKSRTLMLMAADVQNFTSALPIVVADSNGFNVDAASDPNSSRPYRPVYAMSIDRDPVDGFAHMNGLPDFTGRGGMHVRGQSSSGFPKRQYAWELWDNKDEDTNASILGMPADSDWVLQAPYSDKTLMRNVLVYTRARALWGNAGGVRTRFVELFFNQNGDSVSMADYQGVYVLMEAIKRGGERVDIEKLNENVTDPALITGGYIFKKDKPPYSQPWSTGRDGIPLDTHDPGTLNAEQFNWLRNYVNGFETALYSTTFDNPATGYAAFIDVPSFVDNHLFVEMFKEIDGYRISSYYSKTRAGKIRALPVWDYNLALGNANYLNGQNPVGWYYTQIGGTDYPWYNRLFQDVEFDLGYWDRYWKLRRSLFTDTSLLAAIDGFTAELAAPNANGESAATRNFTRWNTLGSYVWPNADGYQTRTTHQAEVDWMKNWLTQRLVWIDSQSRGTNGIARPPSFSSYGGPVAAGFSLTLSDPNAWAGGTIYYTTDGSDPRVPGTESGTAVTLVAETAACEALVPLAENGGDLLNPAQWTDSASPPNLASWISGVQGVGYDTSASFIPEIGTDVKTAMRNRNRSCYIRIPFNVASQASIDSLTQMTLRMKYDDSFAIYLNGQFVYKDARAPATLLWNSGSNGAHAETTPITIEDVDLSAHLGKLRLGANMLAIHGLNDTVGSSDALWRAELIGIAGAGNAPSINSSVYAGALALPNSSEVRARVYDGSKWSPVTSATFIVDTIPASAANLVVSEFDYHPADPSQAEIDSGFVSSGDFEFIELMNIDPVKHINLTNVSFADGIVFTFSEGLSPAARDLAPGGRVVIAKNHEAFQFRHGFSPAAVFSGSLNNDGEHLEIRDAAGLTIKAFTYNDVEPWPVDADGPGYSLVLLSPSSNPNHDLGENWRSSVMIGGSPGGDDSVTFAGDPSADDDADGQDAFLEFVLGSSDSDPRSRSSLQVGVESQSIEMVVDDYLVVSFRINLAAEGVRFGIESSGNLEQWGDAMADFVRISTTNRGDGTATVRYRSLTPWSAAESRDYYRIGVSD